MPASDYFAGLVFFAITVGGALGVAALLSARRLPHLRGAERALAFALMATLALIAAHLIPAIVGIMSRETAAAAAVLLAAIAARIARRRDVTPSPPPEPAAESRRPEWIVAALGIVGFAVYLAAVARHDRFAFPVAVDTVNFHLPTVAGWIETGSIWQIDNFIPELYFGNYPNSGDVVLLATVLPWKNDFLTHFAMYPYTLLTMLATYCLARELRAPPASAVVAGLMVAAIPVALDVSTKHAMPDAVMLLGFGSGLTFLIRHARTSYTSDLVLAGLGLGLAFGTKWYGVGCVAVVLAVWVAVRLVVRRPLREVAVQGAALSGLVGLAGGVWLLRNWILSANPMFPLKIAPFGVTIFDAPPDRLREIGGYTLADYLDQPQVWADYILPQFREGLAGPGLAIAVGAAAAALVVLWLHRVKRAEPPGRGEAAVALLCVAGLLLVYFNTPYTALGSENRPSLAGANSRYSVPALMLAAGVAAWASAFLSARVRAVVLLVGLAAVVDGMRESFEPAKEDVAVAVVVIGVFGALALTVWRLPERPRRFAAVGAVAAFAVAAIAVGHRDQQRYNDVRYVGVEPAVDWLNANAAEGRSVGLAGTWTDGGLSPVYPSFGPRLGNEVQYHGRLVRELLQPYRTEREFTAALGARDYDLLMVGKGRPPKRVAREERWAQSAGYELVATSPRLALLRAPGDGRAR